MCPYTSRSTTDARSNVAFFRNTVTWPTNSFLRSSVGHRVSFHHVRHSLASLSVSGSLTCSATGAVRRYQCLLPSSVASALRFADLRVKPTPPPHSSRSQTATLRPPRSSPPTAHSLDRFGFTRPSIALNNASHPSGFCWKVSPAAVVLRAVLAADPLRR